MCSSPPGCTTIIYKVSDEPRKIDFAKMVRATRLIGPIGRAVRLFRRRPR